MQALYESSARLHKTQQTAVSQFENFPLLNPPTLRQAQGLPIPKFVEPAMCRACRNIETNPEVTSSFVPPLAFDLSILR